MSEFVSKRALVQNLSQENEFDFHENEPACGENKFPYGWFRSETRFDRDSKVA